MSDPLPGCRESVIISYRYLYASKHFINGISKIGQI